MNNFSAELIRVKVRIEPNLSPEKNMNKRGHKRERENNTQVVTYTGIGEQVSENPLPPIVFYKLLLHNRGYSSIPILPSAKRTPSQESMDAYTSDLINAVRTSNIQELRALADAGKPMSACNKFGESILHLACRRSTAEVVDFLLKNGAKLDNVDDYGRTPVHDVCWREGINFEIVDLIMNIDPRYLCFSDIRGATPLDYIAEINWSDWCCYLNKNSNKYWPVLRNLEDLRRCQDAT